MNNNILTAFFFWGIWVILPIAVDGSLFFIYSMTIFVSRLIKPKPAEINITRADLPFVSIIVPTYNEEQNISTCLNFLKIQTYPHEKIEIIVVDNGSIDNTGKIVMAHQGESDSEWDNYDEINQSLGGKVKFHDITYDTKDFRGSLHLITRYEKGKSQALNAGIRKSKGEIIVNIDSRSFLDPRAIEEMVKAFIERPEMGAATGNIEINWNLVYQHDPKNGFILDREGYLINKTLPLKESFLAKSQFLEYLSSFHIGRQFQDITNSMYTMSGAFSAIRREDLFKTELYKDETIVEDTHLTLDLGSAHAHIGYVPGAKAYLKPVASFERLYAQRIRWHRGQIEVVGLYYPKLGKKIYGWGKYIFYRLTLVVDNTFAFPRLIWFFIFPCLILFGYKLNVIIIANLLMLGFYVCLDMVITAICYFLSDKITRGQIRNAFYWTPLLAVYRLIIFFIRVSAYLVVLRDEPEWTVKNNIVGHLKNFHSKTSQRFKAGPINKLSGVWFVDKKNLSIKPEIRGEKL